MAHTDTPWNCITDPVIGTVIRHEGLIIAKARKVYGLDHEANAKRIVECVNACQGLENPEINVQQLKTGNALLELKRLELTDKLEQATNIINNFIKEYDVQVRSGEHKLDSVYHDALLLTLNTRD